MKRRRPDVIGTNVTARPAPGTLPREPRIPSLNRFPQSSGGWKLQNRERQSDSSGSRAGEGAPPAGRMPDLVPVPLGAGGSVPHELRRLPRSSPPSPRTLAAEGSDLENVFFGRLPRRGQTPYATPGRPRGRGRLPGDAGRPGAWTCFPGSRGDLSTAGRGRKPKSCKSSGHQRRNRFSTVIETWP